MSSGNNENFGYNNLMEKGFLSIENELKQYDDIFITY
jgi:hypothetical protein